jgi:hypothetical protein
LLSQIRSAQSDLDQLLAQLGSDAGGVLADGKSQRELLTQLERTVSSGAGAPGASMRGEIAGVLATTATLLQQARAAADQSGGSALATAQARTRASVEQMGRDIYERRIFDPYLQFASGEDEAAYRRREQENRRAIAEALAERSPAGYLRAARIMGRQLRDAGAHGADASPQFTQMRDHNAADIERLETALGRHPNDDDSRLSPPEAAKEQPALATPDQLASVLGALRAAGIQGGITAEESGHGLGVDGSGLSQDRIGRG